ncbi:MAG: CO2 hydration protein [Limnospira sp. PMC 1291.21]|uniref:CO2 hydration protein n=1 Tax=unclassified Limnospira TaxID=2642885 RepID=UPI0028E15EC0|nr:MULTISPECIES: CO2 hydration protein [unclassified Limnospira]MDT9178042.1 CO2 hydration protein [Limnospira sp. PMC 1238.20]MDT9193268.1 CO2 hydration protein [Limnospira sp. PMC 1245.20]MDT9203573.1 CO2 hydration protein [Limnospira sp. PMC 1243.20]MDT9208693.1 CO2 hydration protein [Limnospira sp. PMC 1252.20]MDT9213903.1 CO2 hydration protein [Limnospira sp. PMC 1256.20]
MTSNQIHPLFKYIERLEAGDTLLPDSPQNLLEVVGILKSYGIVLDAYSDNLIYVADHQFLVFFPFFKYFNGDLNIPKLLKYWWHDRINYEYAEYCMKGMLWHGGGGLDSYLDSSQFQQLAEAAIQTKFKGNSFILLLHQMFPEFLPEQVRQSAYYSALGQFWRVMSDIFISLSDLYDQGEIKSIPAVVQHILDGLVAAANNPITYGVKLGDKTLDIIPKSAGLTFLMDTAVPYVEAIFFRGTPFPGTVSYNAQVHQIPSLQKEFTYGALYADPLPIGGSGIPPTQLMQDMRHFLPDYLHNIYNNSCRGEDDLRVQICQSFQKSMFCVTTAAIKGLAPYPLNTDDPEQKKANRAYLENWLNRFTTSRLSEVNQPTSTDFQPFLVRS